MGLDGQGVPGVPLARLLAWRLLLAAGDGLDPSTSGFKARLRWVPVEMEGLEPSPGACRASPLPLNHIPVWRG